MDINSSKQKRPAPVLYFFARVFFRIYNKYRHNIKITGDTPKGPCLILSNHTSNEDYKLIVSAASPNRVNFLCTYHFFTFKKLYFWLNRIGAIPKHQFSTDLLSMRRIQHVVQKENGIVYIAPEGTVYANGKLGYIAPSIAKMVKFLKVPVYTSLIQGAGLGNAKWSKNKHKDNVTVETHLIIDKDEVKSLDLNEIYSRILTSLQYNEFEYQKKYNIKNDAVDKAEGFETMFYKCPICNSEFTLSTKGNVIECSECHTSATIDENFRFIWSDGKKHFDNYIEWYDWQFEDIKNQIKNPDFVLEDEVEYGIDQPGVNNYLKVGKGIMTLSHSGWDYKGTFKDNVVEEHDEIGDVFLATLKTGLHFELPRKNDHNRVFYPKDGNTSMKWHLASRAFSELLAEK